LFSNISISFVRGASSSHENFGLKGESLMAALPASWKKQPFGLVQKLILTL
jgi:hypothetical protein